MKMTMMMGKAREIEQMETKQKMKMKRMMKIMIKRRMKKKMMMIMKEQIKQTTKKEKKIMEMMETIMKRAARSMCHLRKDQLIKSRQCTKKSTQYPPILICSF